MKTEIILTNALSVSIKVLLVTAGLAMAACSTVRDATDWVPGVDSNEEIQAEKEQQEKEVRAKEREAYKDKAAFAPIVTDSASEADAKINVNISQKYEAESAINRADIGIEVNAGVVTLTGSVDSDKSAVRAIALAKSTPGVSKVISRLVVIKLRTQ
ncbi:MAG: BON domain-containing protein [Gammaproteobacteria bacterium]|nr:BON domain-containing protein [Gammaproteobacteria bacterium]